MRGSSVRALSASALVLSCASSLVLKRSFDRARVAVGWRIRLFRGTALKVWSGACSGDRRGPVSREMGWMRRGRRGPLSALNGGVCSGCRRVPVPRGNGWMAQRRAGPTFSAERGCLEWSRRAARAPGRACPGWMGHVFIVVERNGMGVGKSAPTILWATCVAGVGNVGWLSTPDA